MHPYAAMFGQAIGGLLAIAGLSLLAEWALFKRVMDDPAAGKAASVFAAWVIAMLVYSTSYAPNGGGYAAYTFAAIVVAAFKVRKGLRLRAEQEDGGEWYS